MVVAVSLCCCFYVLQCYCDGRLVNEWTSGWEQRWGRPGGAVAAAEVESLATVGTTFMTHDLREKTAAAKPPTPAFMSMMFRYGTGCHGACGCGSPSRTPSCACPTADSAPCMTRRSA
uniref:Secreted protein n=1 Tax=Oryza brachyantha TaxID=4533 RepID=J3L5Z0_ORYBR